jgi:hypothetical protein
VKASGSAHLLLQALLLLPLPLLQQLLLLSMFL